MGASSSGRIARNIQFKLLAEGISRVFSLGLFILIGRMLGDSGYGEYAYPLAFAALFSLLQDWGTNTLIIRELAQDQDRLPRLLPTLLTLKLGLTLLTLVVTVVCAWVFGFHGLRWQHILWATLVTLGMGWIDTLCALYIALDQTQEEVRLKTFQRLVGAVLTLALLFLSPSVLHLLQGLAVANGMALLYGSWRLRRFVPGWKPGQEPLWPLLYRGFPFWLTSLFVLLYLRVDVLMLGLLGRSDAEIGWYQAVVKGMDLLNLLPNLALLGMYPVLAEWAHRDRPGLKRLSGQVLLSVAALVMPVMISGIWLAEWGINLLLGAAFQPAAPALQVLLVALPFMAMNQVLFYVLAALNAQRYTVYSTALGLLLNILLNFWWIPSWGYVGAATSTVITEGVVWGLNLAALHWVLGIHRASGWGWVVAATSALCGILCLPGPLLGRCGLGLTVYSLFAWQGLPASQRALWWARVTAKIPQNIK
jgi:O-antigen/teichoic acid export membrane protein